MTRVITLMGSGETAPTMVKVHRAVLEKLGPAPVPAVLIDTPFAFQENARELAARVVTYFRDSLQTTIEVAIDPSGPGDIVDETPFATELFTSALRDARYVFAGPGSPSYALRRWHASVVPTLLVEKVTRGGAVTFASAAALTLGAFTVPVYEIYKAGEDVHWLDGLDVLGAVGMHVAVIPHYNNAEGGTHDTRYCYLGERRLAVMEEMLPEDHFVLGVDEHTACVVDLEARTVQVAGLGVVTVRRRGHSVTFASGEQVGLDAFLDAAVSATRGSAVGADGEDRPGAGISPTPVVASRSGAGLPVDPGRAPTTSPLLDVVHDQEAAFATAVSTSNADAAVTAILGLEQSLVEWSTDVPSGDELDRARASLRAMVVELGNVARSGMGDPRDLLGPYIEVLLELRRGARDSRRFDDADLVRSRLADLGVELRDGTDGTDWLITGD